MIQRIVRVFFWITMVLLVIVIAGFCVLRSQAFHRFVLTKLMATASEETGGRVDIENLQVHWSGLRIDLYGVVLHGTEPPSRAPLLQVQQLLVAVKIVSLWHRKIDFREILIDHPTVNVYVDKNGNTNLPHPPPPAPGTPPTNVFDLAIGHLAVNSGDVDYNDRHTPLYADLQDLNAEVSFDPSKTAYNGSLGYRNGRIQFGDFNPVQHTLQASFGAAPSGLTIESLTLNAGASVISLHARLQNYRNPSLDGSYQASLSTTELGNIIKSTSLPAGQVDLQGTVQYVNRPNQPLLDALTLAGHLHSPALALRTPQARASVRALSGEYRLSGGTLEARNVRAQALGGSVRANLTLAHLAETPTGKVTAALSGISLDDIGAAVGQNQLRHAAISGTLNATLESSWQGSGQDLQLRSDATISASAPVRQGAATRTANVLPVHGALHLDYNGAAGVISLTDSELSTPHTTFTFNGTAGKQSSLSVQAHSDDLRELDQLALVARNLNRKPSPTLVQPLGLAGAASFTGQLRGSMPNIQLTGQLSGTNLEYKGASLSSLRTNVALSPSNATLSHGQLQTSDDGEAQFTVSAGLKDWSYTPQSPISVDLTASKLQLATLERIANQHYPITGVLAAHISVHGSQTNLAGQGSATVTQAVAWNQPIQDLSVRFQGAGSSISSTLQVQTPAGSASGRLTYDFRTEAYHAQLTVPNLQLQKLVALHQGKLPITGVLTASLQGQGTVKNPQLVASAQVPKLVVGQQTLNAVNLQANVAQQKANATLATTTQGVALQAQANVDLVGNYNTTAKLDVPNVQIGPLLATYFPEAPSGVQGHTEVHATLHGPLKQPAQIQAELDIPTLNVAYQTLQIGNASPIRAVYRDGVLSLDQCVLKGTGTELQLQATVPLKGGGNLQAKAHGTVDLHLIQLLNPQWDSSGQIALDVNAAGALKHPDVNGSIQIIHALVEPPNSPLGAQNLNATLAIHNGRMDIQNFTGEIGGGKLTADGFATFQPSVQFNLRVTAKEVRLRYPVGTRALLSSTLVLAGSTNAALLSGRVTIDRVSLTKDFNISTFADQFSGASEVSSGQSITRNVKLNIFVNSASDMALANNQFSLQGSANLLVHGTLADPVILGRTDITGGELFYGGNRYVVESGVISFVSPVETEPLVNLHVTTTINSIDITMNFEGPVDRMQTSYTSNPPLAPIDIINLIATGQTTEAASASPTTPESVIAGQLTSQFSSRVQKLAGISSLTIDPNVGGQPNAGVARLGIQQRVTKNLYFSFSTDLTNSNEQTVQVQYQATKRFAVSATRDENGIYTVQIKLHKSY